MVSLVSREVSLLYLYFKEYFSIQMTIRTCQILAGSSNPDDKFGFGLRTVHFQTQIESGKYVYYTKM
jgi:hypothetical protein